jgi:glycosyltransferase involved in cell wall biosynthesis
VARRKERIFQSLAQADRIFALSAFQQRLFISHGYPAVQLGLALHGIETAPLAAAREARRSVVRHQAPRRVVFMGTLVAQKGLHILIEALGLARDARVRLEVYGADGGDPEYNRRVHSLGASDPRITFHGVLEKERLGEAFVGAAALAAPALWYETEPLTPKSALYCGVPVAASRIGSLAEMVSAPDDGWLLPPGEPHAWAEWLSMLANADHLPTPLGDNVPTADDFAEQMFRNYRELSPATGHA